uniref:Uncharacterized protein n=1 Tax=Anguilla anguilla TaxID=7936 RepID=A0A0E9QIR7_ANGAN
MSQRKYIYIYIHTLLGQKYVNIPSN